MGPVDGDRVVLGVVFHELTRGWNGAGLFEQPCDQFSLLLEQLLSISEVVGSKL